MSEASNTSSASLRLPEPGACPPLAESSAASAQVPAFPLEDLESLREEIRHTAIDCFQAAELMVAFLRERGFGAAAEEARTAALRSKRAGCSAPALQRELAAIAFVM